jgi:hypothetical protein
MPVEYETPLYWTPEERKHLAGTNVAVLTQVCGWLPVCTSCWKRLS